MDYVCKTNDRLGVYYLENGASMRPSDIVYDRQSSSFSKITPTQFDWDKIFENCDIFHFSGISPSLSKSAKELTEYAVKKAKEKNILISCDLNFRSNLWSPAEAQKTMIPLMQYVDILIGGKMDPEIMLGIGAENDNDKSYEELLLTLSEKFSLQFLGLSLRESFSADHNDWSGLFFSNNKIYKSKKYQIQIVDRVGAGDAFSAGLIYGIIKGLEPQDTVDFAIAASALAHTFHGDFNLSTIDEIKGVASGDVSGRIKR
jgi:2-dehydro-3-deoxygluconokinase